MSSREQWIWMPHAGHLLVSAWCQFHLNTCVGDFIVSTLGEYVPDETVREITAASRGVSLTGRGDERFADWLNKVGAGVGDEIGYGRRYESMVFTAKPSVVTESQWQCCPWVPADYSELEMRGYNTASAAYQGHLQLCEEWSQKKKEPEVDPASPHN